MHYLLVKYTTIMRERTRSFDLTKAILELSSVIKFGIFDILSYDNKNFEANNWIEKRK